MARSTDEASQTVTRKPDDVGSSGTPAAGGGGHTAEQAAITDMGAGGTPDTERKDSWSAEGEPGRAPPTPGGSSGGHSDRKASRGANDGRTVASGHSKSEREETP